jgi:type III pantothenate kinase
MLLVIDVGNTKIAIGIFQGDRMRASWRVATDIDRMADEYAALVSNLLAHEGLAAHDVGEAILCSVVPPLVTTFQELCQHYFKVSPLVVGAGVKTGMNIRMDNPREVGADRIANAVAASHLYGQPVIVIDLGTATTFDVVSKEGDYVGGAIAPGIGISAEALCEHTAQLPRVELVRPAHVIGKNTITAMQSGLIFGYAGLIESIVSRIRQELRAEAKVIATGSLAGVIAAEMPMIEKVNLDLTLIGLNLIHKMNRGSGDA